MKNPFKYGSDIPIGKYFADRKKEKEFPRSEGAEYYCRKNILKMAW